MIVRSKPAWWESPSFWVTVTIACLFTFVFAWPGGTYGLLIGLSVCVLLLCLAIGATPDRRTPLAAHRRLWWRAGLSQVAWLAGVLGCGSCLLYWATFDPRLDPAVIRQSLNVSALPIPVMLLALLLPGLLALLDAQLAQIASIRCLDRGSRIHRLLKFANHVLAFIVQCNRLTWFLFGSTLVCLTCLRVWLLSVGIDPFTNPGLFLFAIFCSGLISNTHITRVIAKLFESGLGLGGIWLILCAVTICVCALSLLTVFTLATALPEVQLELPLHQSLSRHTLNFRFELLLAGLWLLAGLELYPWLRQTTLSLPSQMLNQLIFALVAVAVLHTPWMKNLGAVYCAALARPVWMLGFCSVLLGLFGWRFWRVRTSADWINTGLHASTDKPRTLYKYIQRLYWIQYIFLGSFYVSGWLLMATVCSVATLYLAVLALICTLRIFHLRFRKTSFALNVI